MLIENSSPKLPKLYDPENVAILITLTPFCTLSPPPQQLFWYRHDTRAFDIKNNLLSRIYHRTNFRIFIFAKSSLESRALNHRKWIICEASTLARACLRLCRVYYKRALSSEKIVAKRKHWLVDKTKRSSFSWFRKAMKSCCTDRAR